MTKEENKLWYDFLKDLPVHFYRQRVIENFIVDFFCPSMKLIIEIDGSQHYSGEQEEKDRVRDKRFSDLGYIILRYSNLDININFKDICEDIYKRLRLN